MITPERGTSYDDGTVQSRSVGRRWAILTVSLYVFLIMVTIGAHLMLPHTNEPGGCDGIGFGCTLPPSDSATLLGVLVGVALVPICALVGLIMWLVSRRNREKSRGDLRSGESQGD